jgi:hypothetical protein
LAAFSFHVVTESATAALGHDTRTNTHSPMLAAILFFMDSSLGDITDITTSERDVSHRGERGKDG